MRTATCPVSQREAATRSTYQPRRPRRSPLYQLLEDHFEEFLLSYEERFPRQYGPLRSEITRRTVYKYLDCGILDHGFARVVCPQCKAEFLIAYSCKTRLCPSCHAKKLTLWSDRLSEELLEPGPLPIRRPEPLKMDRGINNRTARIRSYRPMNPYAPKHKTPTTRPS